MKKLLQNIWQGTTGKRLILGITCILAFVGFLSLLGVVKGVGAGLDTQSVAQRWSPEGGAAQISCFFSRNVTFSQDSVMSFEHSLDSALVEASIVNESENPGARLWADAYSAPGTITLASDRTSVKADAVGIGGDFFLFHPLKLVSGAYFSGNDVMKDYCVVDEDLAWQLFGSSNIVGQMITIQDIPHIIVGVVEQGSGKLAEAAGLDSPVVYVSYETLSTYGQSDGITCYEIVMPNPVESYALNYVKENIGVQDTESVILENSSRYSVLSLLKVIGDYGIRAMNGKAIIYPYWENMARGYEDILAAILVIAGMLLLYSVTLVIIALVIVWRHKTWTARSVYLSLKNRAEDLQEKRWAARKARKAHKIKEEPKENRKKRGKRNEKMDEA